MQVSKVLVVVLCSGMAACTDVNAPTLGESLRSRLTGVAAARFNSNGEFVLATAPSGELTEMEAKRFAVAYARTAGRWLAANWEKGHDAKINVDHLSACGRAFYAKSPWDTTSVGGAIPQVRHFLGGKWLTTLCGSDGRPAVSVAIAGNSSFKLVNGTIVGFQGDEVTSVGIPPFVQAIPPTPEASAENVSRLVNRRLADVPELVLAPPPYAPQLSKWRIRLELPTRVASTDDHIARPLSELYYGFGESWKSIGIFSTGSRSSQPTMPNGRADRELKLRLSNGYFDKYNAITPVTP